MTLQGRAEHGNSGKKTTGIKAPSFDGSQPCAQIDPELFFPETSAVALRIKKVVKEICSHCDFKVECLEYAMDNNLLGVWGGLLEVERKRLKRYRKTA
jgi:hypothetical protein